MSRKKEQQQTQPTIITPTHILFNQMATFPYFAESYLKIQTTRGFLVPFSINEIQTLIEEIMEDIKQKNRLIRLIILKARREGVSTWVSGRFFWRTTTNSNRYAMIITHEPEATDFVFSMHKRFYKHLPPQLKPEELYNNKKMLEFNNEQGSGLDSAIRVGTAGKEDLGSSQLIHYLHLSELAKYPKHLCTSLLLSLLQCVPAVDDSAIVMESTAKGVGGEFYDRFWDSRFHYIIYLKDGKPAFREEINETAPKENEYTNIFIPWFVFNEYTQPTPEDFKRTAEEEEMAQAHGLTNNRLQWRRWCIENQCSGKVELFNQEYPTTAMDAFVSGSNNIFDIKQLQAMIKIVPEPRARYELQMAMGNWMFNTEGALKVWEEPKPGIRYAIGGDVAEGLHQGDFSCLDVVDCTTGKQVAHWHGKIPPDQFGFIAFCLGTRYNTAIMAIERNNHGMAVIDKLTSMNYRNLYVERIVDPPNKPRKRYGWLTTNKSKPLIIDNFVSEMREPIQIIASPFGAQVTPVILHEVNCKETLQEMMFFKQFDDGTMGAEAKRKDDRVMSLAIAKYVASKNRRPRLAPPGTNVQNKDRGSNSSISSQGWT